MNIHKNSLLTQFQKLQRIGQGLTSTVYRGINTQKQQICLKIIDQKFYAKPIGKLLIDNQILVLKELNHKNLLKLVKHQQNQTQNIIITDFCEGGNLYNLTKKCKKFTEKDTLIIVEGIVNGLQQLHSKKIIHRDLKPQNIFFKNGEPIIADFGFAVHQNNQSLNKVNAGSPLYMSPEALQHLQFSFDSDVFSLGIIMYEMLKGQTPWTAISQKQLLNKMLATKPSLKLQNKEFQNLILKCLQPKRSRRAKFNELTGFFKEWKNQLFSHPQFFLYDSTNVKKTKETKESQKQQKVNSKSFKLNLKLKDQKQNISNQSVILGKNTHRISNSTHSHYKNRSIIIENDGIKTKRSKNQKGNQNFSMVLSRLDPQKMKFLPSSMIQKFKFILECYVRLYDLKQVNQQKHIPKALKGDKAMIQIVRCKNQKQLCRSISGYIGRMYRLAKNYKIQDFLGDIQALHQRIQSFC